MTSIDSTDQRPSSNTAAATRDGITHPVARPFLLGDAVLTGVNGLAYLAAAPLLADWFGAPTTLLRPIGAFLVVVGLGVALLARQRPISRRVVLTLALLNAVWVAASVDYAVAGDLTTLGTTWTVLQAAIVGGFAAGQVWFARRG